MKGLWNALLLMLCAAMLGSAESENLGIVQLGSVTVNPARKLILFPAKINMTNGLLEYVLVHQDGKVHESLLQCAVKPHEIHAAMLLLGVTATNATSTGPSGGQIEDPAKIEPKGDPVEITVSWMEKGVIHEKPAADWIYNKAAKKALGQQPWVYNGSSTSQGKFLAELSGSIVSLITDLDSLINNTSKGHDDDTIWEVNSKLVPKLGTAVTVRIRLVPPKKG